MGAGSLCALLAPGGGWVPAHAARCSLAPGSCRGPARRGWRQASIPPSPPPRRGKGLQLVDFLIPPPHTPPLHPPQGMRTLIVSNSTEGRPARDESSVGPHREVWTSYPDVPAGLRTKTPVSAGKDSPLLPLPPVLHLLPIPVLLPLPPVVLHVLPPPVLHLPPPMLACSPPPAAACAAPPAAACAPPPAACAAPPAAACAAGRLAGGADWGLGAPPLRGEL